MASLAACSTGNSAFSRACKSTEIAGEGADTLVRPYKTQHWVEQRAVGKGRPGRLESRPQAGKPAPQDGLRHKVSLSHKDGLPRIESLPHIKGLLHNESPCGEKSARHCKGMEVRPVRGASGEAG